MVTWLDPVQVGCGCFSGNNLLELVQLVFVEKASRLSC